MSIPHSFTPPIHSFTPPLKQPSDHVYTAEDLSDLPNDFTHAENRLLFQLVLLHMHCQSGSQEDLMIQQMITAQIDPEACSDKNFLPILNHIKELASQSTWNPEIKNLSDRAIRGITHPATAPVKRTGHC
jgi:hypothetical protein